jgi:hypothetical protein
MGPTTDTVRGNGTGWSGWTTFNATHANTTTRQYPNWAGHEPEFGCVPQPWAVKSFVHHLVYFLSSSSYKLYRVVSETQNDFTAQG